MTQLIVNVNQNSDLEEVISVLNRLNLSFVKKEDKAIIVTQKDKDKGSEIHLSA